MALNKILLSDNLTELTGVKSVVYKEVTNADVNIRPGCVCSASIEVEVYGTQANAVSAGDTVYYYQIDKNNTQTLIGIFVCEPSIETKTSYKFVAYDNAQKLKADFSQWLQANQSNFPMTVYALVSAACTVAGVTLGSSSWGLSTQNVQAFYSDGITCRDILSYAAEIGCCFVRCHTDGNVYFDWYSSNANTIAPSVGTGQYAYKADGLTYANFTTAALDRVAVHPSGEDDVAYIYPTGITSGNTIHIQNNLLLTGADAAFYNAVAQNVYTVMSALCTYRPMGANLFTRENPFRAGDIVSVTDSQGVSFTSIITGLTVTNSGAVLDSTGNETYGEETGNMQKAIAQLASDVVRINKLKVDWADINTAIINYLTANNVTAQNLTIIDENGNVLATFDGSGIVIGELTGVNARMDYNSFGLYTRNSPYVIFDDLRDQNGYATLTQEYHVISSRAVLTTEYIVNDVVSVTINGVATSGYSFNGNDNHVSFSPSVPANSDVIITYKTNTVVLRIDIGQRASGTAIGAYSVAIGDNSESSGMWATVSGGSWNKAKGRFSVASGGSSNNASGDSSSVTGGANNVASGAYSAVLGGYFNTASGSHSAILSGERNIANHKSQTVFGEYNVADPSGQVSYGRGDYIEIVGNGTADNARSNARTLDWNGKETLYGGLEVDGNDIKVVNTNYAATEIPTSNNYRYLNFADKNGTNFAQFCSVIQSAGNAGARIAGRKTVNGTETINALALLVDSSGNPIVALSQVPAWRKALELGTDGALPITIAQGGTGATDAETAVSNLGLGRLQVDYYSISNGSSHDFSLSNSTRGLIISSGSNNNTKAMYLYNVTSGGAVSTVPVLTASGITLTTATNKVTIANSGGSQTVVCILSY